MRHHETIHDQFMKVFDIRKSVDLEKENNFSFGVLTEELRKINFLPCLVNYFGVKLINYGWKLMGRECRWNKPYHSWGVTTHFHLKYQVVYLNSVPHEP